VTTRRELAAALERAVAQRGRFQLIEAMIPAGSVSPTLEGFVAALKRRTAATGDNASPPTGGGGDLDPAPARDP
jgi:indolepyruvate decarboxylase